MKASTLILLCICVLVKGHETINRPAHIQLNTDENHDKTSVDSNFNLQPINRCYSSPIDALAACSTGAYITAHERCDMFYLCTNGKPVAFKCPKGTLYSPCHRWCGWAEPYFDCGDRVVPDPEDDETSDDNDVDDNQEDASAFCKRPESYDKLVAHENCDKFYMCNLGELVAFQCPKGTLYNPFKELCDWPDTVECGKRVISKPDTDSSDEH